MKEKLVWVDCRESEQGQLRVFAIYKTKKAAEKAGMAYQMPLSEAEKYLKREKGKRNPFRSVRVHSMNPAGRARMEQVIKRHYETKP